MYYFFNYNLFLIKFIFHKDILLYFNFKIFNIYYIYNKTTHNKIKLKHINTAFQ